MDLMEFNEENWTEEVLQSELPVLVDFRLPGEAPNEAEDALLEELQTQWGSLVHVGILDGENCPEVAAAYHVTDFPTLTLFYGGEIHYTTWGWERLGRMIAFWLKDSRVAAQKVWN
jgi:thioredoxin 1